MLWGGPIAFWPRLREEDDGELWLNRPISSAQVPVVPRFTVELQGLKFQQTTPPVCEAYFLPQQPGPPTSGGTKRNFVRDLCLPTRAYSHTLTPA